jgi:hypothetical protein
MIISRLCGGLGNQLFQYAAGRRLAHARKVELILDLSWFNHFKLSNTKREYELDRYFIAAREPNSSEKFWLQFHRGRILPQIPFLPRRWHYYKERAFKFDSQLILFSSGNMTVPVSSSTRTTSPSSSNHSSFGFGSSPIR